MRRIDVAERRARLVRRHRLTPDSAASSALEVARSLVALHSTDPVTVFLSVRSRTTDVSPEDVERELYTERTLIRMICMRRTLFVVPREIVPLVHAACTQAIAARERKRLEGFVAQSGIPAHHPGDWLSDAMDVVEREVAERGGAFTTDITNAVPAAATKLRLGVGTRWESTQNAGGRVLQQLALEGRLLRGQPRRHWSRGQYRWVPTSTWLGNDIAEVNTADAQAKLARSWLASFGPALEVDLRWWAGWTAREARAALASVAHVPVDLEGTEGIVLAEDIDPTESPEPAAALLPTLDPTTMGWKERHWYLGPHGPILFDRNGNAGPTVWWDGRVVGGWSQSRGGEIRYRILEDVGADANAAIAGEAERLADWLGEVRFSPGFLPPFQRELAS